MILSSVWRVLPVGHVDGLEFSVAVLSSVSWVRCKVLAVYPLCVCLGGFSQGLFHDDEALIIEHGLG